MGEKTGHGSQIASSPAEFARIALALAEEPSIAMVCARVLEFLAGLTGCDQGGVALVGRRGVLRSVGATCAGVQVLHDVQRFTGDTPAGAALAGAAPIAVPDVGARHRWPGWCAAAVQAGVGSAISVPLIAADISLGVLSCYWRQAGAFDSTALADAVVLAGHASLALAAVKAEEELRISVSTRTTIGQAQGILMERYGIGDGKAFEVLRRYSQDSNVKLFDVAARIVATRRLPESR